MTERTKTWYAAAMPSLRRLFSRHSCCLTLLALCVWAPAPSRADAGPPYLTNDPGTPGNGNWEINLAAMPTRLYQVGRNVVSLSNISVARRLNPTR